MKYSKQDLVWDIFWFLFVIVWVGLLIAFFVTLPENNIPAQRIRHQQMQIGFYF